MDAEEKLKAIGVIIGVVPAGPAVAALLNWWRNPGAPVVEGVTAYDDIPRCKELAAQGFGPAGTRTLQPDDLAKMLDLCDKIGADTQTQAGIETLVEHGGESDTASVIYALLTGWSQAGQFKPSLFIGGQRIADLVAKAKAHGTPGIAGNQ